MPVATFQIDVPPLGIQQLTLAATEHQHQGHDVLELGIGTLLQGFLQSLGLLRAEVALLGVVGDEQDNAIGWIVGGAMNLLPLAQVVDDLEQDGQLVHGCQRIALGTQRLMGFRHHVRGDRIEMHPTEARQDVIIQKANGCRKVSPVLVDMGNVDTFDELGQGDDLAQGLLVLGRVFTQDDTRTKLLGLLTSLVESDGLGITNLVLPLLAVLVTVAKGIHLAAGSRNGEDEASDDFIVVISLGTAINACDVIDDLGR